MGVCVIFQLLQLACQDAVQPCQPLLLVCEDLSEGFAPGDGGFFGKCRDHVTRFGYKEPHASHGVVRGGTFPLCGQIRQRAVCGGGEEQRVAFGSGQTVHAAGLHAAEGGQLPLQAGREEQKDEGRNEQAADQRSDPFMFFRPEITEFHLCCFFEWSFSVRRWLWR